uniref:SHSP domain-containing protein n=1 Tax=Gadus morhua TaxID=8049 RepID=A0A8C4ZPW4_GADMO
MFSDESKFCISFGNQDPRVLRKTGEAQNPRCLKSSVKFPQSVMVWGAMSSAAVGPLCFLRSRVNAAVYQEVLEHFMLPAFNCDPSGFTVHVDVKLFSPEDLLVKVSGDFVEVQGKHEEKKDGSGTMTRQFSRRYLIQGGVDTMALESTVSPEGILIIFAPMLRWSL